MNDTATNELDVWCGQSGVWTQLSFWRIIDEGGYIDVAELSPADLQTVLRSLSEHALRHEAWRPVVLEDDQHMVKLGQPGLRANRLKWSTIGDEHDRVVRSTAEYGVLNHAKQVTWFTLSRHC